MPPTVSQDEINRIIYADHPDPFEILGLHEVKTAEDAAIAVRAFLPYCEQAWAVLRDGSERPLERLADTDFFEALIPTPGGAAAFFSERAGGAACAYRLRTLGKDGQAALAPDPYSFLPVLSERDLELFSAGTHCRTYDRLGAQVLTHQGVAGVAFAVWAPNAARVSVIGDFNRWDGRCHPMRRRGNSGIWELFIPGLGEGTIYKYEIKTWDNALLQKADPQAFAAELRPRTASVVWNIHKHAWADGEWLAARPGRDLLHGPLAIYEVHLGSWMRTPVHAPGEDGFLNYRDLAERLAEYVTQQGYTHVELMPMTEHPLDLSWGYQVTGYFAPTRRFGTPDDFQYFVDVLHQHGIGVIVDWVPAHFPKDDWALSLFDGTALYEYGDVRLGEHLEWGTKVFNWARIEVAEFLLNSALFWLDKYHIDGLRVDAVASMLYRDYNRTEWVPNEYGGRESLEAIAFLRRLNERAHAGFPGTFTCAEESTAFPAVSRPIDLGGLGFTFKWNMGWMHDTLDYIGRDPLYRKYHHGKLTFGLMYAFSENFILPISHDEVVHLKRAMLSKMPGDNWQQFANLRLYFGFMWTHPGKKLLFMGQDFGQWTEWTEDKSIDWHLAEFEPHRRLQAWVAALNRLYRAEPSLYEQDFHWEGFEWIDANDWENSVLAYLRKGRDPTEHLVVVCNFTPVVRHAYRLGVPELTTYREVLNSDAAEVGGSNVVNNGELTAEPIPWQSQPCSLTLTLPPLGVVVLKPEPKS